MTLSTSGYTVGSNRPLNHARILWKPIAGTVTAGGTGGALAANDYTNQRWAAPSGVASWLNTTPATVAVDTYFIAAHNLAGKAIRAMVGGATRINFIPRSQEFDNAAWGKTQVTVSANVLTAPDGTLTADKIVENTADAEHYATGGAATRPAGTYTVSIFVHESSERNIRFGAVHIGDTVDSSWVIFNIASKTFSAPDGRGTVATSQEIGGGWWRLSLVFSITAARALQVRVHTVSGVSSAYAGGGTSGIFVWGAQLVAGASATSYVATAASAVASDLYAVSPWVLPIDNTTIAILANNNGVPFQTTKVGIEITEGAGVQIGIIRAGVALQMQRPVYGGVKPIGLSRKVETRHTITETGQWAGRTIQRVALETSMDWPYLTSDWYRSNFEPFAQALPQTPFGLIQNPLRMPESVAWAWTDDVPEPENMGILDFMQVSLNITGYAG